jgi:hypothetical protein
MYVVWRQVDPIVQWFAIGTSPRQQLDQFEKKSFFLTQENVVYVKPCL